MGTTAPERPDRGGARLLWLAALVLFAAAAVLRLGLVNRHGLWADELFSLAMATGHSLEHPADQADPSRGDYVEAPRPLPPSACSRYLEHENPPAGPGRVIRAVLKSDTSPPLYYLLLYGWTLVLGTGDAALRLFSVAFALACFPVLWSLARQTGGRAACVPACTLFTFSPLCVFYSTEGRMYSLLWFWTVCTMWLALRLRRRGARPGLFLLWAAAGAAGLLTHYFYAFVWAAAFVWLLLHPGRFPRKLLPVGAVLTGLIVFPWYVRLPEMLAGWRVTASWLHGRPGNFSFVREALCLPWSFFSIRGVWGVGPFFGWVNAAIFLVLAVAVRRPLWRSLFSPRGRLLWLCLLGACLGPVLMDLLRGTFLVAIPRYAIAGMPAAFLLAGLALARLRFLPRAALLTLVVLACLVGVRRMYLNDSRSYNPFVQLGMMLTDYTGESDLVIVHSIPSGVAGVARYMESHGASAKDVAFASWVGQLGQRRVPEDLQRLAAGRKRIFLVKIHTVGDPSPEEDWLHEHAALEREIRLEAAQIRAFVPRGADTFPREPGACHDRGECGR